MKTALQWFDLAFNAGVINKEQSMYLGQLPDEVLNKKYDSSYAALDQSFLWRNHEKGYDYWEDLSDKLYDWHEANEGLFADPEISDV